MKVYNIRNTHEFFEKLSNCKDTVEIIDQNGARLQFTQGSRSTEPLSFPQFYGKIDELELHFQNGTDCQRIMRYLMNRRNKSA